MKSKHFFLVLSFICLLTTGLPLFGQYRQSMRLNTYEGVSDPKKSEVEALLDARNNAYRNLAASFSTHVDGIYVVQQIMNGPNPDDVIVTVKGESTITIRMYLTGIEELEKTMEKTTDSYIARVLITISEKGKKKAEEYLEQEAIGFRAYDYFSRKFNFTPVARTAVPNGYSDFSSWLNSNCLIFQMKENQNDFLDQFEILLQKFNRKISVLTNKLGGKPVKIIYNLPDYYNDLSNVMVKMNIRSHSENGRVLLSPDITIGEFKAVIQKMPDSRAVSIAGIAIDGNQITHVPSDVLNEIAYIAGNKYGLQAQILHTPDQCLNAGFKDSETVRMITENSRYAILLKTETVSGVPIPLYSIPAYNWTSYRCVLFDAITGKISYNDTAIGGHGKIPKDLIEIINDFLGNM